MQRERDLAIINKYFDTNGVSLDHRARSTLAAPISADYMDAYLNAKVLRDFIQKKIETPDEKLIDFAKKNNIKGILLTANELELLQSLVNNHEEGKEYLTKTYGFSTMLN